MNMESIKLLTMKKRDLLFLTCIFLLSGVSYAAPKNTHWDNTKGCSAYLFVYFTGNGAGEEAIRFAVSRDGYNYRALNGNRPILDPVSISSAGGVRDPHILRCEDGKTFYMVATDMQVAKNGWGPNYAMVLLKSEDLVHWSSSIVDIPATFPEFQGVNRVWAPQTIYDPRAGKYMIYWSMRFGEGADVIYYAYANREFTALETSPKVLFKSPAGKSCIDGDIIPKDGKYHLFFKTEGDGNGLKKAVADAVTGPYVLYDRYLHQTDEAVEGSAVFRLIGSDSYILMYDLYMSGKYQFTRSRDLTEFEVVDQQVSMNFKPRHGTVLPITRKELDRLTDEWSQPEDWGLISAENPAVKRNNIVIDDIRDTVLLPVRPDTDLTRFSPEFTAFPGTKVSLKRGDFTKGPVVCRLQRKGHTVKTYRVTAQTAGNPVLDGYFADPEILYAESTGKFYLYPTSDGFTGWSGTYFKTFSSPDLVHWTDEGVILDLKKDVSWASRNAWAPAIIEKKTDTGYRYYYYFTAAQKIGVATAEHPTGPFTDSGQPLVAGFPEGVTGGQQIDPDVFCDPVSGENYLYWGNGYLAVARLNPDMVSLETGTTRVITPEDGTFREGVYVFFRNGHYYFLWSEDDTRSENYRVRYGVSDSPFGPIRIPENNLILSKDPGQGIFGTGHNSVLQIPGTDEWYIVYHRFTRPKGITMGDAAGFHREVCIDRMEFDADGYIKPVKPTLKGIDPVIFEK